MIHYWVSKTYGITSSSTNVCPVKHPYGGKIRYLGFTEDVSWPKKLNTGRLLHKCVGEAKKKIKRQNVVKALA